MGTAEDQLCSVSMPMYIEPIAEQKPGRDARLTCSSSTSLAGLEFIPAIHTLHLLLLCLLPYATRVELNKLYTLLWACEASSNLKFLKPFKVSYYPLLKVFASETVLSLTDGPTRKNLPAHKIKNVFWLMFIKRCQWLLAKSDYDMVCLFKSL